MNRPPGRRAALFAGALGVVAVVWFVSLSAWLGVRPGSIVLARQNVLFNSDTNTWIDDMAGALAGGDAAGTRAIHPLAAVFWRPPARALASMLQFAWPRERAEVVSARVVVALVAAAGVAALAYLAMAIGVSTWNCVLLFWMYLLFTTSSTIALPEHFGISSGLLSIAFVAPIVMASRWGRVALLGVLAVICGGTTITNAAYPVAALYQWGLESVRARRIAIGLVGIAIVAGTLLFVDSQLVVRPYVPGTPAPFGFGHRAVLPRYAPAVERWYAKTSQIHAHVLGYSNLRLMTHPFDAVVYAIFAVVAPVVGPPPAVRTMRGAAMVTYEAGQPLRWTPVGSSGSDAQHVRDYWAVQGVGALLWLGLFAYAVRQAFANEATQRLAWLPAAWILFNLALHNLWGDDLFLYAPHWSWALMALIILGARNLSVAALASVVIPIAACQILTLTQIKHALLTITF